jgi:hypothetical protein
MIAFELRKRTRRPLASGLLAVMLGATSAGAEVLVPFTPGNQLRPSVQVTVTNADGLYTYAYSISLDATDPAKQQKADKFVLELRGDVSSVTTPRGWRFGQYRTEPLFSWSCIEAEPLRPGEIDDGNLPPCRYSIAPGSTLAGFSFRSVHPPGNVPFMIQGEKKWPVATDESDDLGPGINSDVRVDSVSGETTGPVPVQSCAGAADGVECDDGYFCNGPDTCLSGSCSHHAGNPCPGKADGDADCAEDCDEDENNCSRYDAAGSPCPDDGNPCTKDYCSLGDCVHTPGHAGAFCGPPPGDGYTERTCTGASIVCPSTSASLAEIAQARLQSERQKNQRIAGLLKKESDALARIRAAGSASSASTECPVVVETAKALEQEGDGRGMEMLNDYFRASAVLEPQDLGKRNPAGGNFDVNFYQCIALRLLGENEIAPAMLAGLEKFRFPTFIRPGCQFFDMRRSPRRFDARYAEGMLVAMDRRPPIVGLSAKEDSCAEAFKSQLANADVHRAFFDEVYPRLTPSQKALADRLGKEPPYPVCLNDCEEGCSCQ